MGFMLTRQQVHDFLFALGFVGAAEDALLTCAGIRVRLLDAPRIAASSARGGLVYLAVSSASQLEEQLTSLLGYRRPASPVAKPSSFAPTAA